MPPTATEDTQGMRLVTERTPVGPEAKDAPAPGERAVSDAIFVVLICWAILFALVWSLRRTNI